MIIHLHPQMRHDSVAVVKAGDTLTINGDVIDLSVIPEGAELPAAAIDNPWLTSSVRREAGVLHVSLILPHGPDAGDAMCFPDDLIDPPDGAIALPSEPEKPAPYFPPPEQESIDGDD